MADPLPAAAEPANRGALIVHDRVAERIAARAALDTAGVQRRDSGLSKLTGSTLPKAHVSIAGERVRAAIDIAVPWNTNLNTVSAGVRDNVASALAHLAGLHVDGIDVTVTEIVSDSTAGRRVQ